MAGTDTNTLVELAEWLETSVHPYRKAWAKPLRDAIAALSPVLPEDVQRTVDLLRRGGEVDPNEAADLIERLASDSEMRRIKIKLLHARIEELEAQLKTND